MSVAQRFTTGDQIAISFRTFGDAVDGQPVVLQHGFASSGVQNWVATGLVEALVGQGRRVIVVDARGHGQSDKPHDPGHYGEGRMARDLVELFDVLDITAVDLVGYSMGAIVSLLTAVHDSRIRRLVVGGVGAGVVELGGVDTRVIDQRTLAAALRAEDPTSVTDPAARRFRLFADASGNDLRALAAQVEAVNTGAVAFDQISVEAAAVIAGTDDDLARNPGVLANALSADLIRVPGDHLGAVRSPEFRTAVLHALR
ncbi:alpha/beta fold hydrolase [Gordonia sp. SID5947]|uniref:alpha/beta fold hydrolase n=1 Tax=Gordonia sp. SID5947 TaxID=2690315 RepID=UPI00136CE74C|nr:alpha/beta hydrolase [Gordonia sp. SID5947]MYR05538.1 alpha/beta fold hydrolase [Gordonia sp. SID5947]